MILKKSPAECVSFARSIAKYFPIILPAQDVIAQAEELARDWLKAESLVESAKGHKVQLMSEAASNRKNILMYGFADPGEAVGATGLLCLMKALKELHPFLTELELSWNFIPCLNLDDQPMKAGLWQKS